MDHTSEFWDSLNDSLSEEDTAGAASILCQKCGICCNGTLFSHVTVHEKDVKKVEKAGVTTRQTSSGDFEFAQPCPQYCDESCSIYLSRPQKCRDFYCNLQRNVLNGSIPLEAGEQIVSTIKGHAVWLRQRAKEMSDTDAEDEAVNLRDFLYSYEKRISKLEDPEEVTASDRELIKKAFQFFKLADRFFQKARRLTKYGDLLQRFPEQSDNHGHTNPEP
jgi:Fe-S-cluster containining protein